MTPNQNLLLCALSRVQINQREKLISNFRSVCHFLSSATFRFLFIKTEQLLSVIFDFASSPVIQIKTKHCTCAFSLINNAKTNHGCIHQNYLTDMLRLFKCQKYMVYTYNLHRETAGIYKTKAMYFWIYPHVKVY